jgi:hypothetical protein
MPSEIPRGLPAPAVTRPAGRPRSRRIGPLHKPRRRPDAAGYAEGVRGDRDLKLSRYEVFRFGATGLRDRDCARTLLARFFADLFRRFP